MTNNFVTFQQEVEAIKKRCSEGEISTSERDETLRQMQLTDERWGDKWMLSPTGQWFRKAKGATAWIKDYPSALIDGDNLPPLFHMNLAQISRTVQDCKRCPLHQSRTRAVAGEGTAPADIMLIGEGPGFYEDKQARPFVGASGKFLTQLLADIGYKRTDVFIANVVKCRPPNNRDPQPEELEACHDYLERQIAVVDPKVIVTLGRYSMQRYFPGASISKIHGQPKRVGNRLIVPMFHPAAALHQPKWRPQVEADFARLPQFIKEAQSFPAADKPEQGSGEQLSLF